MNLLPVCGSAVSIACILTIPMHICCKTSGNNASAPLRMRCVSSARTHIVSACMQPVSTLPCLPIISFLWTFLMMWRQTGSECLCCQLLVLRSRENKVDLRGVGAEHVNIEVPAQKIIWCTCLLENVMWNVRNRCGSWVNRNQPWVKGFVEGVLSPPANTLKI